MTERRSTVVLDAEFLGPAGYRSATVRGLAARLEPRGFELVVPEVVVWEWSERLHRPLRDAGAAIARAQREAVHSGLPFAVPHLAAVDVDDVVDQITADLQAMPAVRVLTATLADGAEAVRNQVLQLGASTCHDGVKTGAAQSLIVSTVERCAHGDLGEPVVLCSRDPFVGRQVATLECETHVVRSERELWQWFGTSAPVDESVGEAIRLSLAAQLDEWIDAARPGEAAGFPLFSAGLRGDDRVCAELGMRSDPTGLLHATVHQVESIEVHGVEVVDDGLVPRPAIAFVTAVVTADVQDCSEPRDGDLRPDALRARLHVDTPITVDFDRDWVFERVTCTDAATITTVAET